MKRFVAAVLVVILAVMLLASCGQPSSPEGTYVVKTIGGIDVEKYLTSILEETGISLETYMDLLGMKSLDDYMKLELKADHSAVMSIMDEDPDAGTWSQSGDKITVTINEEPAEFTLKGNELTVDLEGELYVFVKK